MQHLAGVMARDLAAIRLEVEAYPDDASLWIEVPGLPNTGGTLVLHLAGNLQHFVGAMLGGTGFKRDRDAEFTRRGVSRADLLQEIDRARAAVEATLPRLSTADLERDFPQAVAGVQVATGEFLVHLVSHLGYHIGQIDSHRRLATGQARSAGAESIPALRSARPAST